MTTSEREQYDTVAAELIKLNGKRVRITYRHNDALRQTGVVSTKDYGHCIDVRLNHYGGQMYGDVTRIERMGANRRYATTWEAR